jgi:hypothetical protein
MGRKFKFTLTGFMDDYNGVIEIDQSVIDTAMNKDWQSVFYDMPDEESVVSFLAYNMTINDYYDFRSIEGFCGNRNWDGSEVKIIDKPQLDFSVSSVEEIKDATN